MAYFNSVSIVVPTYREAENIPLLVRRIYVTMLDVPKDYEIIIVDDNSPDGIEHVVRDLKREGYPIRLIVRTKERGLSSAVIRGFRESSAELLVCMDADLSHPPERLREMIEMLEQDESAEFVIGSRYVKGGSTDDDWGFFRLINSKVATALARPFTSVKDPMAGFFALPAHVFERARNLNPCGYKIGLELIVKCGIANIQEAPIHFRDRLYGQSKLNFREQLRYLRHIKRLADFKFGGFSQLAQFLTVGASGMAVDLLLYAVMLNAGLALGFARALAIAAALTWNFSLNRRITFSFSRRDRLLPQYSRYVLSSGLGAVISWCISVGLTYQFPFFKEWPLAAALIGVGFGTISNFLISKFWVFRRHSVTQPAPLASLKKPKHEERDLARKAL